MLTLQPWVYSIVALCASLITLIGSKAEGDAFKDIRKKMGSRFEITAVHPDRSLAKEAVKLAYDEVDRIETLISSWREDSETSRINRNAGIHPVQVSSELLNLIRRAIKVSDLTKGAFDITFASVGRLWDFKDSNPKLPDAAEIKQALENVDYKKVVIDEKAGTVFLSQRKMRIGLGGIGKGYAANRAAILMQEKGVLGGVVNAGGDLFAFGHQDGGEAWTVGVADPSKRDQVLASLELTNQAVVTSGDYESFFVIDGKRYSHILDPRTGYPVAQLRSVTIICPDAELADALATATSVLGPSEGMELINRLRGVEAVLIDATGRSTLSQNLLADTLTK